MLKQARFLEDIAERALVGRQERAVLVLPDLAVDLANAVLTGWRPAMQRSTVVLPQPEGPNSAVTPLAGAVKPASSANLPSVPRNSARIAWLAVTRRLA